MDENKVEVLQTLLDAANAQLRDRDDECANLASRLAEAQEELSKALSAAPAKPEPAVEARRADKVHAKVECFHFNTQDVRLILTDRNDKRELRMHNDDAWFIVEAIAAAHRAAPVAQPLAPSGAVLEEAFKGAFLSMNGHHTQAELKAAWLPPSLYGMLFRAGFAANHAHDVLCTSCGGSGESTLITGPGPDDYEMPCECRPCGGTGIFVTPAAQPLAGQDVRAVTDTQRLDLIEKVVCENGYCYIHGNKPIFQLLGLGLHGTSLRPALDALAARRAEATAPSPVNPKQEQA